MRNPLSCFQCSLSQKGDHMKIFKLLSTLFLIWTANARADKPAVHGMLLFGSQKTYASHLPMFHAPHDYQVVLELSLQPAADATALALYEALKTTTKGYFTLVPKPFDLTKVIDGTLKAFSADVYQGHFERNGQNLGTVEVQVEKVIYAAKLNPNAAPRPKESYIVFGDAGEYFAIHKIVSRPDFDAVVTVQEPMFINLPECRKRFCPEDPPAPPPVITFPLALPALSQPGLLPQTGDFLGSVAQPYSKITSVIYTEQDDLKL